MLGEKPQETWSGIKSGISHLSVFGSIVHAHVPDEKRSKLDEKSENYTLIGYNDNSNNYKLYSLDTGENISIRSFVFN